MNRSNRLRDRPLTTLPMDLSDLAHACESLVIRDTRLPQALACALVDIATALRAEADRRHQD
jgi:hypothetical protein